MGVMKDFAIELEYYWRAGTIDGYWSRRLPDGNEIAIVTLEGGEVWLVVDGRDAYKTIQCGGVTDALIKAGAIAQEQLAGMARTWAA